MLLSSAAIVTRAHQPWNAPNNELHAEKPQIVIASSAANKIQEPKVALRTNFKVYEVRNDFIGKKGTVHEVSYSKESGMSRSDIRGSTVLRKNELNKL